MEDRLDGVAVFVEAAATGGFAKAAERLGVSRSGVGKAVARLEARLGVRLFHRTTRMQKLTDDGQIYYEHCLRALEELRMGAALLESAQREVTGKLRVSMPLLFGRHCIAPILLDFAKQHPKLDLELSFSDQIVDLFAENFDLAVRNGAPGEGSGLRTRKLAHQRKVLCAAPAYLAASGQPANSSELVGHDLLVYSRGGHLLPWLLPNRIGRMIEIAPASRFQFDDLEAILDAAIAGLGIAWLPHWLVQDPIEAGRLAPVFADLPATAVDIYLVWPGDKQIPMRLRLAIDTLIERIPSLVPQ